MRTTVEVREPHSGTRLVEIDGATELGRDGGGLAVSDETVSRRHARLEAVADGLRVTDLGSTNGTWSGDRRVQPEVAFVVPPGAEVRFGDGVVVRVVAVAAPEPSVQVDAPAVDPAVPALPAAVEPAAPVESAPPSAAGVAPPVGRLLQRAVDGGVVHYRAGSAGEKAAGAFAGAFERARRRLSGLGSGSWGATVNVFLVDPFPDPSNPQNLLTSGSVVNARANEIWMVVTSEAPPEAPERPLALLFGSVLPAAADVEHLLEGYGLLLADAEDPDAALRGVDLPPFEMADGELRAAMSLSFVRFLANRSGRDAVRQMIGSAQPGRVETAAEEHLGLSLVALEEQWRMELLSGQAGIKPTQFLKLSMRYLRPHLRRQVELGVYMLLGLAFTMSFPFISRQLFDSAIPSGEFSNVMGLLGVLGAAFVVSLVAGLRQAYLSAYVGGAIVRDIRAAMFDRLQFLSTGWFARRQQGDVLSRMFNDVALLEQGVSETLRQGVLQVLTLIVSAVVVLRLNLLLGVIILLGAPVVGVVYRLMSNGARKRSLTVQERQSALLGIASENYSAQAVVKGFGLEDRERMRFGGALNRLFTAERKLSVFGGMFGLTVNLVVTGLRLLVLGLGAWLVLRGELTLGTLVAFLGVMGEVIGPVTTLTNIGQEIQTASGALLRVNEILEEQPDIADREGAVAIPPVAREVALRGVSFGYTPDKRTLSDLDLVIEAGKRVAFVGPSGAGKSSVMQLIMRNYDPDAGGVFFDGIDIRGATLASVRSQMGIVFQDNFLFDTTIRENIAMGRPGATDDEIVAAARAAEVHDFIVQLPRGYDTMVGERGGRLSGGQRQRVAIARALVRNPTLLLLDEATSALDPRTERLINDTLQKASRGRTTISITHRLASVVDYDRVFVLAEGRLVEAGTHAELVGAGGVYSALWAEQTGGLPDEAPSVDAVTALRGVSLFAGLEEADLAELASGLGSARLQAGQRLAEGGGLHLVLRGRARLHQIGLNGTAGQSVDLGPGDSFGLGALLGRGTGAELEAVGPVDLAVLDATMLRDLAADFPSVAAAITGSSAHRPDDGRVLGRFTMGPTSGGGSEPPAARPQVAGPSTLGGAARHSGVLRAVR